MGGAYLSQSDGRLESNKASLQQWGDGHFSDSSRLLKGHEFRYMKENGKTVFGKTFILSYAPAPDGNRRIGIVVSKKFHKRAVKRNRAHRIVRESYRLIQEGIAKNIWFVVIARKYLHGKSSIDVQQEMIELLKRENLLEIPKKTQEPTS